jgi:FAD/FMN-containing dehydrogenase/short-subunit dehydrogenase
MSASREPVSNWGLYPKTESRVFHPETVADVQALMQEHHALIARGNGRCYGDASLSNYIISTTKLNRILAFDKTAGIMHCEAGVLLDTMLQEAVPAGFFLPVTPGTKFITIGGALASDIHGKNHHVDGVISDHVTYFKLVTAGGELLTVNPGEELFIQTAGGMGLTGIITEVGLRLKPIETAFISQRAIRARNLDEIFELFEKNQDATYSVAWIDCLSRGEKLGRSVLLLGEHATAAEVKSSDKLKPHKKPSLNVPFQFPKWILNPLSIRIFNFLFYHKPGSSGKAVIHYDPYFYPLDKIHNWNRIYGSNGFIQYQFVLPKAVSYEGVKKIIGELSENNLGSFLAVLKLFGKSHEDRYLHFPMNGYTLALDIKVEPKIWPVLDRLDEIVTSLGGKIYLTKDARMSGANFRKQYAAAKPLPGNPKFSSHQQIRLQQMKKHVFLILGANSDIARQTALLYAKQQPEGHLLLASRDTAALQKFITENKLENRAEALAFDAEDLASHTAFYNALPAKPNWVMYAAGVLVTNDDVFNDPKKGVQNMVVNYTAPVNILNIIAADNNPGLQRIIGMSSVAGLRGRKSNYMYGSTKAGFHQYLFGLRQDLQLRGVTVQAITPGFVKTKMTAHLDLQKNANTPEEIAAGIMRNKKAFVVFPNLFWRIIGNVVKYAPEFVIKKL